MIIDITVAGWRFYLNLNQDRPDPAPAPAAEQKDAPPTHIGTPMVVHPGSLGYYATRSGRNLLP